MKVTGFVGAATAVVALAAGGSAASAQGIGDYKAVTQERLENPEPGNWLMFRGNYAGWGYSPLDQITAENVKELVPVWSLSTGQAEAHQAPPIVNNGVMFVTAPNNVALAIDAKSGDLLWQTRLNSGVTGVPTAFEIDGTQYIAVQAGWGVDAERMSNGLKDVFPDRLGAELAPAQDGTVWVFALRQRVAAN